MLLLLSAIQLTVWCHGEPFLQKPLPSPDKETITCFAGGLSGSPVKAEGLIGTAAAGVTLRENGRIPVRTLLLVDNSRSVSEGSRKKIRALLSAVVEDHREEESFWLSSARSQPFFFPSELLPRSSCTRSRRFRIRTRIPIFRRRCFRQWHCSRRKRSLPMTG